MTALLLNPFVTYHDQLGYPLDQGYIYVGEANKDPKQFPIDVYLDVAKTNLAIQPLRTINGTVNNGYKPIPIFTDAENYSVLVLDKNEVQVFYDKSSVTSNFGVTGALEYIKELTDTAREDIMNQGFVARIYDTALAGVAVGTGVPAGAYYNVRSSTPNIYADEYLNNNGIPQATGKTYPTLQAWTDALATVTATGDAKIADVAAMGELKKAQLSEIAAAVSGLNAGLEFYETQTALLAASPSVAIRVAKALDTKKVWLWKKPDSNPGTWVDTGLSELDQAKGYADANPLFKPVLVSTGTLDDISDAGYYLTTVAGQATTANGYPYDGATGELEVKKASGSTLITQYYKTSTGRLFYRQKATSWSAWLDLLAGFALDNTVALDKGALSNVIDLNTVQTVGRYVQQANLDASTATSLNYPFAQAGFLYVEKLATNAMVQQTYVTISGDIYSRTYRSGAWLAWGGASSKLANYALLTSVVATKTVLTTSDNLDDLRTIGMYLKNVETNTADTLALNHPTKKLGTLFVYKLASSSMVVQEFKAVDGTSFIRYYAGSWTTAWQSSSAVFDDYLEFTKSATALNFYEKGRGGRNYLRTTLNKIVNPEINLNNWGINRLNESDITLTDVRSITTNGVWEFAAIAAANSAATGDHSGGSHGDEVLQQASFIIDGIIYAQDSVIASATRAKEIIFIQKSTIYIEATTTVLCYRECKWIFKRGEHRLVQRITFPAAHLLNTAWLALCPVLRKANQDNTGEQITDKELRSSDGIIVDVSEPGFAQRNISVKTRDSITLSGTTSGASVELYINNIVAPNPQAFVQNTAVYNKVYVSGFPINSTYTTAVNEIWEIDVTFKVNTRN